MTKAITSRLRGRIDDAFPYQICINLTRRPERWEQMQLKFARHGFQSVRRFSALDGDDLNIPANWRHTPGAYGCLRSHLQVVSEARRLGVPSALIFEDDVVFDPHLHTKFKSSIKQLPPDWDMLFFGALHKDEPIKISDNIARITKANSTYAYAVRHTVFDDFIELNRQTEEVLDNNSLVLQEQFNCYCFLPHLAWVETGYSDAQNRLERHWYLQESLVLFGSQVDRILSNTTIVFAHGGHTRGGRATDNIMYLVNYYNEFFSPYVAIVIVEQGVQPTLNSEILPTNCKYAFLRDEGPFDRKRCFETGISNSEPTRKFVILSDSDVYLEILDVRANLRMCEQYDCATGFSNIIDLTNDASLRLRNTNTTRGLDTTETVFEMDKERRSFCCFINREAIQISAWEEGVSAKVTALLSLQVNQQFRVFQSPNHALRLH